MTRIALMMNSLMMLKRDSLKTKKIILIQMRMMIYLTQLLKDSSTMKMILKLMKKKMKMISYSMMQRKVSLGKMRKKLRRMRKRMKMKKMKKIILNQVQSLKLNQKLM